MLVTIIRHFELYRHCSDFLDFPVSGNLNIIMTGHLTFKEGSVEGVERGGDQLTRGMRRGYPLVEISACYDVNIIIIRPIPDFT